MGEPSARWVWNIHWSTRRLAFRVVLFTCRMCRILLLSSKIRKILSTLQLHRCIDCCLPLPCVIMWHSTLLLRCLSGPGFMPANCLLRASDSSDSTLFMVLFYSVKFVTFAPAGSCRIIISLACGNMWKSQLFSPAFHLLITCSSSVPRLFSVSHLYHFLYYYRLTTAKGVYLVRVQSLTVISLLSTPPGAIVTPPGVYWFDCFTIV